MSYMLDLSVTNRSEAESLTKFKIGQEMLKKYLELQ